jgi:hypothetical protein
LARVVESERRAEGYTPAPSAAQARQWALPTRVFRRRDFPGASILEINRRSSCFVTTRSSFFIQRVNAFQQETRHGLARAEFSKWFVPSLDCFCLKNSRRKFFVTESSVGNGDCLNELPRERFSVLSCICAPEFVGVMRCAHGTP